nr:hypothetical protein Iba_chr07eCG5920 [Ipomoea batatas]
MDLVILDKLGIIVLLWWFFGSVIIGHRDRIIHIGDLFLVPVFDENNLLAQLTLRRPQPSAAAQRVCRDTSADAKKGHLRSPPLPGGLQDVNHGRSLPPIEPEQRKSPARTEKKARERAAERNGFTNRSRYQPLATITADQHIWHRSHKEDDYRPRVDRKQKEEDDGKKIAEIVGQMGKTQRIKYSYRTPKTPKYFSGFSMSKGT